MKIGQVTMRYPAGDPENGPAYRQRYLGEGQWECEACVPSAEPEGMVCENCYKMLQRNDPRKMKRAYRKMGMSDPLYVAHCDGEYCYYTGSKKRNPYPPGRRHDEWDRMRRGHRDVDA